MQVSVAHPSLHGPEDIVLHGWVSKGGKRHMDEVIDDRRRRLVRLSAMTPARRLLRG
jgi:hypothetical protein